MAHARNTPSHLARTAILGGLLLPALSAFAQEAGGTTGGVVQITGTRITVPGASSSSPILSVSAGEVRSAQAVAVEAFFKDLPGAAPASGPATNLGSIGGATIDLRGLGANRTLVLIDGRRLVPFNLGGTVDTNTIPLALLSRVDVVTGGASAAYGADAVAGVANFKLRRRIQGVELSTSYGKSGSGDTARQRTDVTAGAAWNQGRGNVVLNLDQTRTSPLFQGERSFGASSLDSVTAQPAGSGTTVPTLVSVPKGPGGSDALAGNWQVNPATGALVQPVALYNFNPLNYYVTGLRRTQSTVLANYIVNEQTELYLDLFHTRSTVATTLAEAGTALNVYNVPIGNPFMPEPMRQQICARRGIPVALCAAGNPTTVGMTLGRRFIEMGRRANDFDNKVLQYTIGLKGALPHGWQYDAYWNRGRSDQLQSRRDYGSYSRVKQALNALNKVSCVDPSNNCVPLNVFGPVGTVTPAMIQFFNLDSLLQQSVRQDVAALTLSGNLPATSPWSTQPANLAVAIERRRLQAYSASDLPSQLPGEVLGSATPTPDRAGEINMRELSLEALLPMVRDRPGMRSLNLSFAYRHTEFSAAQNRQRYGSFKYGGEWQPVSALRLRVMAQQAVRAPNINELFAPQASNALSNLAVDPCQLSLINQNQAQVAGTLSHLCLLSGVPLPVIGNLPRPSAGQINSQSSGNPNLTPEQARTVTLGLVLEPHPKLMLSLDYYRIAIDQALSRPAVTEVLDACYSPLLNPSLTLNAWCALIQRSPSNGTFSGNDAAGVRTPLSNQGKQATSGFDLNVRYKLNLADLGGSSRLGNLDLQLALNQVQSYSFQATPLSRNRQCLGYYSTACGGPNYRRKFSQRSTWNIGRYAIGYHWRYLSGAIEEPGGIDFLPAFAKIAPAHYLDLSLAWNISNTAHVYLSVSNVLNRMPPIVGGTIGTSSTNSGNTFPQNYDVVGRYFTLGTTFKF
ncbi:TonB-dependent receptor domain-containing protein [Janthinobacterium fluminis]|uniref:TonB-dependent receptor n=1 Tax=Janthinobacterium fluminis TaxID=2987524 RepID=A0ABT5KA75_9BURK|nr:TonB-dependent receptor [Janthinobacterium fluminis]MDC8760961.1 TonB-dependent receptor [Janthinobacterium fluminis]